MPDINMAHVTNHVQQGEKYLLAYKFTLFLVDYILKKYMIITYKNHILVGTYKSVLQKLGNSTEPKRLLPVSFKVWIESFAELNSVVIVLKKMIVYFIQFKCIERIECLEQT